MLRRLAAIIVADIAGYSRLVGLDETGTVKRLHALRHQVLEPLIASHGGRVVSYAGDGALVECSSVVRAVECALDIQRATAERDAEFPLDRRLALRIGVHSGDIIADEAGSIYGDAVNLTARLEQLAEPGGVCLSDTAHRAIAGQVDSVFEHGGEYSLKNIAEPTTIWFWPAGDRRGRAPRLLPPADRASIAVLPFDNIGSGPDDEGLADGVAEDMTTALARLNWLFVVARTSTYALKGQSIDAREAGERLGVRYLLEGTVRRTGNRVRITAQLIEAERGRHVWADRFDSALDDLLDLQDDIVSRTIAAIEPNVLRAEAERARLVRPTDIRAHHLYLRAVALMGPALANSQCDALDQARDLLARAIELDPNYAPALALAAYFEAKAVVFGRYANTSAGDACALELAERAIQAGPEDPMALGAYGFVSANADGDLHRAAAFTERALALNQNSPLLWNFAGEVWMYLGEHERAVQGFHRSMRLNPLDSRTITNATYLAFAHLFLREPEEAVRWAERAVLISRNPLSYRILAASRAEAGQIDEARSAMTELLKLQPNSCLRRSRAANYQRSQDLHLYVEALRKAGAPEEPTGQLTPRLE